MAVTWTGLDLYRQALAGWPASTAAAAAPIVAAHARAAHDAIQAGYPVVSGDLRRGLTLADTTADPMAPAWTLSNDVFYAKIFESGGATLAGPVTAGRVFVPIVIRERRAMRAALVALLSRTAPA